jgi:hypothetical protein
MLEPSPWEGIYDISGAVTGVEETRVRKPHVVMLSEHERAQLHTLIGQSAAPAPALPTPASCSSQAGRGGPGWTERVIAGKRNPHATRIAEQSLAVA